MNVFEAIGLTLIGYAIGVAITPVIVYAYLKICIWWSDK